MGCRRYALISVLFLIPLASPAQYLSQVCKWIAVPGEPITLDSLSIDPSSIRVSNLPDSLANVHYDLNTGKILVAVQGDLDSVEICYSVLPFALHRTWQNRSLAQYDSNAIFKAPITDLIGFGLDKEELFPSEGLTKTGSLTRSISFGNKQSVFVNGQLNLQLEGKITDDLNIRAVITDQNIPFQPEGNTLQLQEFDQVYMQIFNDDFSLTAGDVILTDPVSNNRPASHFLRYNKNVQGVQLKTKYKLGDKSEAETGLGISVAKGQFASITLEVFDGVLGPYKVQGPDGQRFITILANSEKVFVDGKPLQRGFNYDYVVDYNLGEITFTNRVLITKFSRVRVDFEYFVQNYSRTVVAGYHTQKISNLNIYTQVYSEKDNPNRPLLVDLSQDEIARLSLIGDNLDLAVISGADSVEFNQNQVLYKRIDTLVQGVSYTTYQMSTDPAVARYSVKFSELSSGKGNYDLVSTTVNGRVYQWVAPVDGVPQGIFEPVITVPTPNQKQVITMGASYDLSEHESVFSEIAWSNHDLNLFSQIDNDDNQGKAYKGGVTSRGRTVGIASDYKLMADLSFEFNDQYFKPIDRYRYIEFDRDWSFDPEAEEKPADDHILNMSVGLKKDLGNYVNYKLSSRKRGQSVQGNQHLVEAAKRIGNWNLFGDLFLMQNDQSVYQSDWVRTNLTTFYSTKFLVPGYSYTLDRNQVAYVPSDSIVSTANNFREHKFFLRNSDSLRTKFELNYSIREDRTPMSGELKKNDLARTANMMVSSRIKSNSRIDLTFTYRNLQNINTDLNLDPQDRSEHSVMSRVDWFSNILEKHLRTELTYAISNSRELKREFVFLQVNPGEGTHTWRDDNQDGVQDLNEFYEALNHDERNFAKIFLLTDDYVLANNNLFNFRFNARMPRSWSHIGGVKQVLSKLSNNTSWSIDKKTSNDDLGSRFNPFDRDILDENLLALRENFRTTFFFNRAQSKYGVDGGYSSSSRKQLLTDGFESRVKNQYTLNTRLNFAREYNLKFGSKNYSVNNASDFLLARNYRIQAYDLLPGLSWQPSTRLRLTWNYRFSSKANVFAEGEGENSRINEMSFEARWNRAAKSNLSSGFRFLQINFEGDPNTPVGYELLEALKPGANYTWNLMYQRKILSGLQLTINYDGRKSEDVTVVHFGRMQVTALF